LVDRVDAEANHSDTNCRCYPWDESVRSPSIYEQACGEYQGAWYGKVESSFGDRLSRRLLIPTGGSEVKLVLQRVDGSSYGSASTERKLDE